MLMSKMPVSTEPPCKTVEGVRRALEDIEPGLSKHYKIGPDPTLKGVMLVREGNSIISTPRSYGGDEGLYEVCPRKDGKGFKELLGTRSDVAGWLSLEEAVFIAEATARLPVKLLKPIAEKYF